MFKTIKNNSGGRLIASLTSISGVLVLAFPITMIVEKFGVAYNVATGTEESQVQAIRKKRRAGKFM